MKFIQYIHHDALVWVRKDLVGTHRENCLCYSCARFKPGTKENCPIAQELYKLCVKHNLTTPVYECPTFEES
jgi:hypothetical protein